jgi:hypothetical protein
VLSSRKLLHCVRDHRRGKCTATLFKGNNVTVDSGSTGREDPRDALVNNDAAKKAP